MRLKYLTSKLYPVLVEDRAGISAAIVGGQLKDSATSMPTDTVGLSYGVVSAELRTLLKATSMPTDTVGLSYGVVSAELRTLLKTTAVPTDTIGLSYGVVSAELKTTLKRYEQWPKETAAISASIVSGSLT